MSRTKSGHSTLSGLIDSDSEEVPFIGHHGFPTPESGAEHKTAGKKGRGRPKTAMPAKVTKAKAPARRTSGRLNTKLKDVAPIKGASKKVVPTKGNRRALADKTNQQYASDTEEVDEFEQNEDTVMEDELDTTAVAFKEPRPKIAKKTVAGRGKPAKVVAAQTTKDISPAGSSLESYTTKNKSAAKRQVTPELSPEKIIMESQASTMEIDNTGSEEVVEETISRTARNGRNPRSNSRPQQPSAHRRRAGSASDTERSDPVLRRKLGDITKKYENLNVKYQDLREIGLKEAERHFERLKKQSEEQTVASEKLVASLKADIAAQVSLTKDSRVLKKKFESQAAEILSLKEKMAQMTTSLSETQAENKTLATKLAANRAAAASVESANTKTSGNAAHVNGSIRMMGTAEAAQVAQAAQLKEDLYSDLTGLLIRGVKRDPEDDVFDCIQTGRNGTLHFKLAVTNEKSVENYEDAQCQYVPQLDPSRDKEMVELLPDYLVEEITFPRSQAARFYARVVKALTERAE